MPDAVPGGDGTQNLAATGPGGPGDASGAGARHGTTTGSAPTSVHVVQPGTGAGAGGGGYRPHAEAALRPGARRQTGWHRRCSQPLTPFMTNPAGAAIVNAIGPIRQDCCQSNEAAAKQYLVILAGTPRQARRASASPDRELIDTGRGSWRSSPKSSFRGNTTKSWKRSDGEHETCRTTGEHSHDHWIQIELRQLPIPSLKHSRRQSRGAVLIGAIPLLCTLLLPAGGAFAEGSRRAIEIPARIGNIWAGLDHQPTKSQVQSAERDRSVAPSAQEQNREAQIVQQLYREILTSASGGRTGAAAG